jgi:hypothetical protein
MKRVIFVALAVALAPPALAQLYKYVDKDGKTVYSDTPPANTDSKQINVPVSRPANAPAPGATAKTAVERDKEMEKSRKAAAESQKKSDQAAEKAAQAEARCAQAKTAYQGFVDGGRLSKYNDKGERVFLSDDEIASERERSRRDMDEACKK